MYHAARPQRFIWIWLLAQGDPLGTRGLLESEIFEINIRVDMEEGKEIRKKWLHVRLSAQESHEIKRLFKASAERYLSDFARKKLLGKPVKVATRNASQDELIEQLAGLRTELSRLGANYNQAVKKLHALSRIKDFEHWLVAYELDRRKLLSQVEQAGIVIADLAEKWSQ